MKRGLMVDIDKLKKLSCLHIEKNQESFFQKSLDDIFLMMQDIENISIEKKELNQEQTSTDFIAPKENLHSIQTKVKGTLLHDGLFLAPKVIHKN